MEKKEYDASAIQVLEGLDPVRKRPGMYIGSTDSRGLHHLVIEVVDNSIDEAMAGYCTEINISINKEGSVTVKDNGRGIPTQIIEKEGKSAVEVVLTKLHAGGKFGGGGYKFSGGLHGVGVSVVNALSEWLDVTVCQNGKEHKMTFNKGVPMRALHISGDSDITGTEVSFFPDASIFDTIVFEYSLLKKRLQELAFLNKGLKIILQDCRDGEEKIEDYHFEGGIKEYVNSLNKREVMLAEPFYFNLVSEEYEIEVAMQFNESYDEKVLGFANNINTEEGGSHVDGFKNALTKLFNDYGKSLNLIKGEEKLSGEDVREGLVGIISVKLTEPQFEGQTKTKLGNSFMRPVANKAVCDYFGAYLEENPKIAKELINKSLTAKKAREAARNARDLTRRKSVMEGSTLPGKLADCTDKDSGKCEIYIVEGDSAGGTAKQGRDRRFQAILPLRGKILNVEKARLNKVLENEEIRNMITAFGCGISEDCDTSRLRYDRIICMTDADVDGSHIRILLLTFLFRFMRPVVELGHVYIAQPPLYKTSIKNKNEKYFYEDETLEEYLVSIDRKCDVQRYKGLGEMGAGQLWDTTMNPETRTLLQVSMEDAEVANNIFSTLMGDEPELRRRFIEENATMVKELDI